MLSYPRQVAVEFIGSLFLAAIVIGSGIAAQNLSPHQTGLQLLENALATALGLFVLIAVLGPLSGAHFNPVISLADVALRQRPARHLLGYVPAQIAGCIVGALLANAMFGVPTALSTADRLSGPHLLAEAVATAGLVLVVFILARTDRSALAAPAVAAYIGAAYWFTSSTSFANPAIALGRIFSDTFAGIAPLSALGFLGAQLVGGAVGLALVVVLIPRVSRR